MSAWSNITIPPAEVLNGAASSAADRQLMLAADRTAVRLIYGEDRVTGRLLNAAPSVDGKFLVAQFLWGFECDSINDVLLNDRALPAGSTVTHYRGTQLSPPSAVVSALAAQGVTYTATLFGYAQSVILIPIGAFDGQLNVSARVRGRRLYDPRKDGTAGGTGAHRLNDPTTWEWSDCPALAQGDWTANTLYGAGLPVVWSSVATLADANDQLVGGEKRRTLGLTLDTPTDVRAVAETLRAYSGSFALPTAAGVRFVADADAAPVVDLTHENGDLLACDTLELRDTSTSPTAVEIIFSDRTKIPWRDGSAIAQVSGAGTTKPWRLSQVRMPGVTRFSQAMREAIERLNKLTLNDLSTVVEVSAEGLRFEEADIVRLSHPLGPVLKPMRVMGPPIMTERGRWRLQLQEHDAAVYDDSVQTQPSNPDGSFDNPAGPPGQVLGLTASVSTLLITLSRTPSTELDYSFTQYEYSTNGGGTYNPIPAVPINDGRGGATWQTSIQGALRIRARDVDTDGLVGAWSLAYDFTVGPEILPGSGAASATLAVKINVGDFAGTVNFSEAYIHGRDSTGAATDTNGTIQINGASVAVPKGTLVTGMGPVSAFIVWDSAGATFSTTVPSMVPWVMARKVNGGWQYDNNSGWVAFTPGSTHYVIGLIQTGGPDTNSAPGILSATMLSAAWVPDVIAALGTTADWIGVANRPKTFIVRSTGSTATATNRPFDTALIDADTGAAVGLIPSRSHSINIFNRNGSVAFSQTYDIFGDGEVTAGRGITAMTNDLITIATAPVNRNKVLVVQTADEPSNNHNSPGLLAAMLANGASRAIYEKRLKYRGAYILIAITGCGEGNGVENYGGEVDNDPDAWCELSFSLSSTAFSVTGDRAGARTVYDQGYLGSIDATTNKQYDQETDPTVSPGGVVDGAIWRVPSTGKKYQRISGTWRFFTETGTVGTGEMAPGSATQLARGFLVGPVASFNDV